MRPQETISLWHATAMQLPSLWCPILPQVHELPVTGFVCGVGLGVQVCADEEAPDTDVAVRPITRNSHTEKEPFQVIGVLGGARSCVVLSMVYID